MVDNSQAIQAGSDDASDGARFDGLVEQVRHDVTFGSVDDVRAEIVVRLADASHDTDDALVDALVARVNKQR